MNSVKLLVAGLAVLLVGVAGNVLSIDMGADSMKIALVKPGLPFHVVVNPQSKRKTPVALTFNDGERFFGADAMGLQTRRPEYTFVGVQRLLGRNASSELAAGFLAEDQYVAHGVAANTRGGYDVFYPDNTPPAQSDDDLALGKTAPFKIPSRFSVEEVTAMILANGREFSETVAEGKIKDCVIAIPSYFTQNERLALIDAAELAGLNVLSLVDENFAAGVRYSIDFPYNVTTNVLVYNMGAQHTQVSIHTHSSYTQREAGVNRTFTQFKVSGKGWSSKVGGAALDDVMINKFANTFNAGGALKGYKEGEDVRKIPKAMAKLRKNVQKVKEILSANDEYPVTVEALANDKDFKMGAVKRTDFELWAKDVLAEVLTPIKDALADANLTKADISSVEIIGGGVRMPKVQAILSEYFGASLPLGQHLNGDEAVALGGAFVAANRSSAYRVKKICAVDISPFSVTVNITSNSNEPTEAIVEPETPSAAVAAEEDGEGGEEEAATTEEKSVGKVWFKRSNIFPQRSALGTVKKIAFRHPHDISAVLFYDSPGSERLPAGTSKIITRLNITGVEDVVKGPKGHLGTPKIVLAFGLDHSGLYGLQSAEAQLQEMVEVPVPTPKPKPTIKPAKNATSTAANATTPTNGTNTTDGSASPSASTTPVESLDSTPTPTPSVADTTATNDTELAVNGTDAGNSTTPAKPKTVLKKFIRRFPLKVSVDYSELAVQPLSPKDKAASLRTLRRIKQVDEERLAREAAKNAVEAFIYASRNKLYDFAEDLAKITSEEDREAVSVALTAAEDWLYEEGASNTLVVYKAKLAELVKVADTVFQPLQEYLNPTPVATPVPVNETLSTGNGTDTSSNSTTTEEDASPEGEEEGEGAQASQAPGEEGEEEEEDSEL